LCGQRLQTFYSTTEKLALKALEDFIIALFYYASTLI
jgi:hypothetical protein